MTSSHPSPNSGIDWQRELPQHRRWLATVLRARGVEVGSVDEVLQEVHAAAIKHSDQLRELDKVAPWLYRIAVTSALQYRRRLGRDRRLIQRVTSERPDKFEDVEPDPLDWLLANEERQLVRQAILAMPARDAELLLLKYTEDWSYRQLADHLGISTSAVEARLHRAREKMRRLLAQLSPETISH
jgi:RNA polymerase sigma factor (sigma-70 family)